MKIWLWQHQLLPLHWEIMSAFAKEKWINEASRKLKASCFALLAFVFKWWNVKYNTQPEKSMLKKRKEKKRDSHKLCTQKVVIRCTSLILSLFPTSMHIHILILREHTVDSLRISQVYFISYALQNIHINWILKWAQICTERNAIWQLKRDFVTMIIFVTFLKS